MLAKVTDRRGDGRTSFRSLLAYITRTTGVILDRDAGADSDTENVQTSCLSLVTAAAEMRAVAKRNVRVRDPVYHVILSWQQGEYPTNTQVFEGGEAALAALDMQDHQYVFVVHRDTENTHLHLMVNRVHPETGRAVHPGLSHLKLDRCMREVELAQGWAHDRGAYAVVERDARIQIERTTRTQRTERPRETPRMPAGARDMEAHANEESLFTYASGDARREALAVLQRPGATWQDLHAALAKYGLELRIKGQGLGVYAKAHNGPTPVKASSLHESFGRGKLERRLGPYEPPIRVIALTDAQRTYLPMREPRDGTDGDIDRDQPRSEPRDQPHHARRDGHRDTSSNKRREQQREVRARLRQDVRARYDAYRTALRIQIDREETARRNTERTERQVVLAKHQATRMMVRTSGLPGLTRKALYSVNAFDRARDLEELKAMQRERREARDDLVARPLTYREWIEEQAQRGDEGAISQLNGWYYADQRGRKRRHGGQIQPDYETRNDRWYGFMTPEPDNLDPAPPRLALQQTTWRVDRQTGDVRYYQQDQHVFTDSGRQVAFSSYQPDTDAMLAGLLLAREKFGRTLDVVGETAFGTKTVQLVVEYRLNIRFGDAELETQREALEATRSQMVKREGSELSAMLRRQPSPENDQSRPER
jgi:hypothetical protein